MSVGRSETYMLDMVKGLKRLQNHVHVHFSKLKRSTVCFKSILKKNTKVKNTFERKIPFVVRIQNNPCNEFKNRIQTKNF